MIQLSHMSTRNEFGRFLNRKGLTGDAAEVGTHRGEFAHVLLKSWHGERLYCVDHWDVPPGYENQAAMLPSKGASRSDDYAAAASVLDRFRGRVELLKETSAAASARFRDRSLDFVYIDGDHEREGVEADLKLWWPKVARKGVLAGHDFVCPGEKDGGWGRNIQPPVIALAERHGLDVFVIAEENNQPWSWYIVKE